MRAPPIPLRPARTALLLQIALAAAAALALFLATARWPDTPDGLIHLQRVRALSEALRAGVLLPRWFPDFSFGYGYPVLNFYAPAFYYPPALLHLTGLSILDATRLTLALLFGLSGLAMVRLARIWTSLPAALLAGVAYLASSYRLYDLFVRGALPEFAAFLWLPLLAWACVRLWQADSPAPTALLWAALCWAGLLLTHNLTALMAGAAGLVLAAGASLWSLRAGEWPTLRRGLGRNALAFAVGALLSAWYVVPALWEARWVGIGTEQAQGYQAHFAAWGSLFSRTFPLAYPPASEPVIPIPWSMGIAAVAGLLALLLRGNQRLRAPLIATLGVLTVSIWLTTQSSAWVWRLLEPLLGRLQFPWRWQAIAAPTLALLAALLLDSFAMRMTWRWRWVGAALLALFVVFDATAGLRWQAAPFSGQPITRQQMLDFDANYGQVGMSWTGEFLPIWVTEQRWAIGREPPEGPAAALPAVALEARLLRAGYLSAEYEIVAPAPAQISLHTFFYPAWRLLLDGRPLPTRPVTALGLLAVDLPAGAHRLAVEWGPTPAVWAGRTAAVMGWLAVLLLLWRARRRTLFAIWVGVGLVALIVATGVTERMAAAQGAPADFGPVQLAGTIARSARAEGTAEITLHWLVQEPSDELTAFVHILDGEGRIVAQHDGPLAGPHTPASRRLPGQIVDVVTLIPLPAELAPGRYELRIGLYPPGHPEAPLLPVGESAPYVDAGAIEVRR